VVDGIVLLLSGLGILLDGIDDQAQALFVVRM